MKQILPVVVAFILAMVATLGVPFQDYWHWQLLSLFNFVVAPTLAVLWIGCFYHEINGKQNKNKILSKEK